MKNWKSTLVALGVIFFVTISSGFAAGQKEGGGAGAKVVLHVTESMGNQTTKDMWADYKTKFEKQYPNYDLQFEAVDDLAPEQFYKVKIAADEFPDIAKVWSPALLINSGVIREMPAELQNLMLNPNTGMVNGKVYTLSQMVGYLGFFYNKDIFKKAGITDLPTNWQDFIAACKKIKAIGVTPLGMAVSEGGFVNGYFDFLWAPLNYGPQPNWSALRSQGKVKYNNPATKRAMQMFVETIPFFQDGANSAKYDEALGMFMNQESAMFVGGIYNIPAYESGELKPAFNIGYLAVPQDKPEQRRVNYYGDNLMVINSKIQGDQLKAAIDYLKFFYSPAQYPVFLNAFAGAPTAKGFGNFVLTFNNPIAKTMASEMMSSATKLGIVVHAAAAQGDNIWPEGMREIQEKITQEIAAGNRDYDTLMNLFDAQWDIGLQQAKAK